MKKTRLYGYTDTHARAGTLDRLPPLESWENQYPGYEIRIVIPEYTSICPKTGLADFGTITIDYMPEKLCVELKSLKYYIAAYRNVGVFMENAANRILDDLVKCTRPVWAQVTGDFTPRGGMRSVITARYPRKKTAGPK